MRKEWLPARHSQPTTSNQRLVVVSSDQTEEDMRKNISLRNRNTSNMLAGNPTPSSNSGTRSEDRLTTSSRATLTKVSEKGGGGRGTHKNSNLMLIESNKDSKVSLGSKSASSYTITNSTAMKQYNQTNTNTSARNHISTILHKGEDNTHSFENLRPPALPTSYYNHTNPHHESS